MVLGTHPALPTNSQSARKPTRPPLLLALSCTCKSGRNNQGQGQGTKMYRTVSAMALRNIRIFLIFVTKQVIEVHYNLKHAIMIPFRDRSQPCQTCQRGSGSKARMFHRRVKSDENYDKVHKRYINLIWFWMFHNMM